jgi:hypothetical protein
MVQEVGHAKLRQRGIELIAALGRGTFHFENLIMPPLTKNLPKNGSAA